MTIQRGLGWLLLGVLAAGSAIAQPGPPSGRPRHGGPGGPRGAGSGVGPLGSGPHGPGPHMGFPLGSGFPAPSGSMPPPFASGGPFPGRGMMRGMMRGSGMAEIAAALRDGTLKREDFEAKMKELRENAAERRKQHLGMLRARFGPGLLRTGPAREEFRVHARRMAYLNRAAIVAQTELSGEKQKKTLERIDHLVELERARHEKKLEELRSLAPAPSASGAAEAAPSASGEP